jgi:hypothetical protein
MTWVKQTDHAGDALSLLLSQYESAAVMRGLVSAFMAPIQDIEDQVEKLLTERGVDTAIGAQLDVLGAIVGEPRKSRTDELYRPWVKARVLVNRSGGEIDTALRITRMIVGRVREYVIEYVPLYPAAFRIAVTGGGFTDEGVTLAHDLQAILLEAAPVGVGVELTYSLWEDALTFTFASGDVIETSSDLGFADDAQTTGGHFAGVEG